MENKPAQFTDEEYNIIREISQKLLITAMVGCGDSEKSGYALILAFSALVTSIAADENVAMIGIDAARRDMRNIVSQMMVSKNEFLGETPGAPDGVALN